MARGSSRRHRRFSSKKRRSRTSAWMLKRLVAVGWTLGASPRGNVLRGRLGGRSPVRTTTWTAWCDKSHGPPQFQRGLGTRYPNMLTCSQLCKTSHRPGWMTFFDNSIDICFPESSPFDGRHERSPGSSVVHSCSEVLHEVTRHDSELFPAGWNTHPSTTWELHLVPRKNE